MPDLPLVSIVTPTLNQAGTIEDTIRSISNQEHPRVEHIVVDGGSTDGTLDILRRYEHEAGLRWTSEPDNGMYEAINKGLKMAGGQILTYTNSDDALFPWAVSTAVGALEAEPDADVVFGDGLRIHEANGCQELLLLSRVHPPTVAALGSLVQPSVFFRRRLLEEQGPFDERLRYVGDLEYWLRALSRYRFVHVDEILAAERWHSTSLSVANSQRMAAEGAAMRAAYRPRTRAGRTARYVEARVRDAATRRSQLVRFGLSCAMPLDRGGWRRFRAAGVRVQRRRLWLGLVPRVGPRALHGAVQSPRGAALLGISRPCAQAPSTPDES